MTRKGINITTNPEPHSKPPRSALLSLVKIFVWLLEERCANLLIDDKNTLLICDRYYHDLLVDPKRYRYGGPRWASALVGRLIPRPDLWVLLDAPTELLQKRKQEVVPEETERQRRLYLSFIKTQRNSVIIDASQALCNVVRNVEDAVTHLTIERSGIRG